MRRRGVLHAFLAASAAQRWLALEALAELALAAALTRLPAASYTRQFGSQIRQAAGAADEPDGRAGPDRADEIGWIVAAVARRVPFRAVCLQQAMAASRMLRRRAISAEVRLGVNPDAVRRGVESRGQGRNLPASAHAWVVCQGRVIVGAMPDLDRYAVLGRFQ